MFVLVCILVVCLVACNAGLLVVMRKQASSFSADLRHLLAYQATLLDRIQAPEIAAATAPARLQPRVDKPKREGTNIVGRAGVGRGFIPASPVE